MNRPALDFATPRTRRPGENIVPMINVVFLLLIFFLMTATIRPPKPVESEPPEARTETDAVAPDDFSLHLAADGTVAWGALRGDAAVSGLLAALDGNAATVTVHADRTADSAALARLLARLSADGILKAQLVVAPAGSAGE